MIRIIIYLALVAVAALAAHWLIERPGSVDIVWLEHRITTSVGVLTVALLLIVAALVAAWWLIMSVIRSPERVKQRVRSRRLRNSQRAITRGLIAVGAGDADAAARFAAEAKKLAGDDPLTMLLAAQAAQMSGNRAASEQMFTKMMARPDLKLLGLHGLFVEARRRNDVMAARTFAEEAAKVAPAPQWAGRAVLEFRCASGDWLGALSALDANYKSGLVDRMAYRRQRAVLLTERAKALFEQDRDNAKAAAFEAVKLAPDLVPAAAMAGRFLVDAGDTRKAARTVEAAWRVNPHPDLADIYINLRPGDAGQERLARAEKLANMSPGHVEGALALARAAIDAQAFPVARKALMPLSITPTQRSAVLMAELEEAETGNIGRARAWMARAVRAARDPAWTADGFVSDTWMAVSPATGRLDAFEWKVPVADLQGPVIESEAVEPEALPPASAAIEAAPAEPAPSPREQSEPSAERAPAAPGTRTTASPAPAAQAPPPVIPLVLPPDDPGPGGHDEIDPVADRRPESKGKIRGLFR